VQARCKHCDELMGARHGQGTSALLTHMKRCKKRSQALKIVQDLSSTLRSRCGIRLKDWSYDPEALQFTGIFSCVICYCKKSFLYCLPVAIILLQLS
jgi:hypothetical protein